MDITVFNAYMSALNLCMHLLLCVLRLSENFKLVILCKNGWMTQLIGPSIPPDIYYFIIFEQLLSDMPCLNLKLNNLRI